MLASTWQRLLPASERSDPLLAAIEAEIDSEDTAAELTQCEAEGKYPDEILARLEKVGLAKLFSQDTTLYQACSLNALAARRNGSVATIVAGNTLALLPAHIAATPAQRDRIFASVSGGSLAAILLTEWHGPDLLSTRTRADRDGDSFVVSGDKHLVIGGQTADVLITLVRTSSEDAPESGIGSDGGFSVLMIERDDCVVSLPRYRMLPGAAADVSGVKLDGARVPIANLIGGRGEGLSVIRDTLSISRGAISALAAGAANRAWDLAAGYSDRRSVAGTPMANLGGVAERLHKLSALDHAVSAMAVKATAAMNALGQGAGYYAAAARLACCQLAERAVDEGRRILGERALLDELPYARLVRDVTLYSVLDGSSRDVLDHLQAHLEQLARREAHGDPRQTWQRIYDAPPVPIGEAVRSGTDPLVVSVESHAREMGADDLSRVGGALLSLVRWAIDDGCWELDQALRHGTAEVAALLEAALAAAELVERHGGDPAVGYIGTGAASMLRRIASRVGADIGELDAAERSLARRMGPMARPAADSPRTIQ